MNKKTVFSMLLAAATVVSVSAQKLSGDISQLKGQQEVNLVIDFSQTLVNGKAKQVLIDEQTLRKTAEERERYINEWDELLPSQAYDLFTTEINKRLKGKAITVGNYPDAEYTINIKLTNIAVGYFAGITQKASALNAELTFVKTGETTPFGTILYKKHSNLASSYIPYFVTRIVMSFGTLGVNAGNIMNKSLK